jgi:vitamin B12 transporter
LKKLICTLIAASAVNGFADTKKAESVVVTATRTEQAAKESLAPVTVFTAEDIERIQPKDLPDLLSRTPGVELRRNGGPGSTASLFVRGTNSSQLLVLINGVATGSATLGTTALEYLDPTQIERVELVRGPRSSLYGASAVGGVLQIFTKQGAEKTAEPSVLIGYGKNDTKRTSATVSGSKDTWMYSLGATHYETDGIDHLIEDSGFNADDDAYRNTTTSASVGQKLENEFEWHLSYLESNGKNEYDEGSYNPDARPYTNFRNEVTTLNLSAPVNDTWTINTAFGHSKDDTHNKDQMDKISYLPNKFITTRDSSSIQNDIKVFGDDLVSLGFDYLHDHIDTTDTYIEDSRHNDAVFGQYQLNISQLEMNTSLREDDNSAYGHKTTGNTAWRWNFSDDFAVTASYGTAFKAPSFNDLYYPASTYFSGNPNLKPEESENTELEFSGKYSNINLAANIFNNHIDDLISSSFGSQPVNIDKAVIQGIELIASTTVYEWQVSSNATYLEARDDNTDLILPGRPRAVFNLDVDRQFNAWEVGGTWRLRDRSFEYPYGGGPRINVSGSGTVDLRGAYYITPELKTQLSLSNIFDQNDATAASYNPEGFTYMLSLRYTPQ